MLSRRRTSPTIPRRFAALVTAERTASRSRLNAWGYPSSGLPEVHPFHATKSNLRGHARDHSAPETSGTSGRSTFPVRCTGEPRLLGRNPPPGRLSATPARTRSIAIALRAAQRLVISSARTTAQARCASTGSCFHRSQNPLRGGDRSRPLIRTLSRRTSAGVAGRRHVWPAHVGGTRIRRSVQAQTATASTRASASTAPPGLLGGRCARDRAGVRPACVDHPRTAARSGPLVDRRLQGHRRPPTPSSRALRHDGATTRRGQTSPRPTPRRALRSPARPAMLRRRGARRYTYRMASRRRSGPRPLQLPLLALGLRPREDGPRPDRPCRGQASRAAREAAAPQALLVPAPAGRRVYDEPVSKVVPGSCRRVEVDEPRSPRKGRPGARRPVSSGEVVRPPCRSGLRAGSQCWPGPAPR
jgi:hypothetical protein